MTSPDTTELYRAVADGAAHGIVVWHLDTWADDRSLRLVYANPAAQELTGAPLRESPGRLLSDVFPSVPSDRIERYAAVCRERTRWDAGYVQFGARAGVPTMFAAVAVPVLEHSVMIEFRDVTARERLGDEARDVLTFLDTIIDHLPAMVFVKDAVGLRFRRFNRAGEELLGLSRQQLLGKSDRDFFPPDQAEFFVAKDRQVLRSGLVEDIPEEPIQTPRGTRWLHTRKIPLYGATGQPTHLLGVSIDVTERREAEARLRASHHDLEVRVAERTQEVEQHIEERRRVEEALARTEEQLRHAQKMEAVGRLAGGIAHDFNNLLSVVLGYSALLLTDLPTDDARRPDLEEIRRAGERAAELTRQLLAFSRQQVLAPQVVDLGDIVRGMERMLPRLLGEDVVLTTRMAAVLGKVKADPGQLEQVIMNLVINARDAMPGGGRLLIETANVELDERYAAEHVGVEPGPHVMLAISDTGAGMDRATLARIFDPFFTTKDKGKGTGLGLSTVFGIVKQSGGSIWVYSEPGQGTTFKVYLPMTSEDATLLQREQRPIHVNGTETILLVEDEDQVRGLAATVLRRLGYLVLDARSPAEARQRAVQHAGGIDLLLTDVVLPDMTGRALAHQLLGDRPSLRVLFMSGYTDDAIIRHGVLEPGVEYLEKPLMPDTLARRVREVLDAASPATLRP